MTTEKKRGGRRLRLVLSAAIVIGLAIAAVKYLSGEEILDAIGRFNWVYAAPILILSVLYLFFKALRFITLLRPLTDLPAGLLMRVYFAGQPATFIPGGVAVRAALLAQAGVPPGSSCGPIIHGSLLDQLMFVLATLLAALWFEPARQAALTALVVLAVLTALLAFRPARDLATRLLAKLARRVRFEQHWELYCASLSAMHKPATIGMALLWSALAFITPVFMFRFCLQAIDEPAPFFAVLLAYTLPSMAGRLTVLPGGVGVTEAGMIGLLEEFAEVSPNSGAAAATLFRIGDSFFQAVVGAVVYLFFWRGEREPKKSAPADSTKPAKAN